MRTLGSSLIIPPLIAVLCFSAMSFAADSATIHGMVTDPLGAVVANATVDLLLKDTVVDTVASDNAGVYNLAVQAAGRYSLRVSAPNFRTVTSALIYVTGKEDVHENVTLAVGALTEEITVTATGTPTPQAQIGSAITVLEPEQYAQNRQVSQSLSRVPGLQLIQTGETGGLTALFTRGGNNDANKVLLDGVPFNDVGGFVDFANIANVGVGRAEILRGPDSTIYGADALAGVVSLTTERGATPLPLFTYAVDGGNFGTYHQEGSVGGAFRQVDYFADLARFDTANSIPGSQFHIATVAGDFGWKLNSQTTLRTTVRHIAASDGNANQYDVFLIPDSAAQKEQNTVVSTTLENQTTTRWRNLVRYGALRLNGKFTDFVPTGIPFYDSHNNLLGYAGAPVVLHGANGYSTGVGQAFFQSAPPVVVYPNYYWTIGKRDLAYAQSDYRITSHLTVLFGFKYEHERGDNLLTGSPQSASDRNNYSYTMALAGDVHNRLYYTIGGGIERNTIFGAEATPRASLAYHLIRPSGKKLFSGTKLRASFSKGIKEPSIGEQNSSLYALLAGLTSGSQLISQYHISPIGAVRSRSYDGGIDQEFLAGRGKIGITYFHNQFGNVIEFVPQLGLEQLGVPSAIAPLMGAEVNSQAFRAQGFETEVEYKVSPSFFARGGYTYLDAVVQRSFTSDNTFGASFNADSNFSTIPIGVYSPLRGARPFRRAPHSGYFGLYYSKTRWNASLNGTLVGRRDDSTFAYDEKFGTSLLLPNRNLDSVYQKIDLSGSYKASRLIKVYGSFENLLSQHYSEAFGYPSLPLTFRAGVQMTIGGESWKLW